jgi:hypothetical protein
MIRFDLNRSNYTLQPITFAAPCARSSIASFAGIVD